MFNSTVYASGEGNIDSGGGGMGQGSGTDFWSGGNDGVRVSVIDINSNVKVGKTVDYTNKSISSDIFNFGKYSKLDYKNGSNLTPSFDEYKYKNPNISLPQIIKTGGNNITAIKNYFCSEYVAEMIADDVGIDVDVLMNGDYKLLLEPIGYFTFQGVQYGMTATEVGLYDQLALETGSKAMRSTLVSFSHQSLPLAMFLENSDLGFNRWTGSSSGYQSNSNIINYLGIGIVSYTEVEKTPDTADVEYRVDTEVITAVTLNTIDEINPDETATVTFNIDGVEKTMKGIVIPQNDSQVVWTKWRTPQTEQQVTITIETDNGYLSENKIVANIIDLDKNPPPDPKAVDRNDSFNQVSKPNNVERTSANWSVWWAYWFENWVWIENLEWESKWVWVSKWVWISTGDDEDDGYWEDKGRYKDRGKWVDNGWWEDHGWYEFETDNYTAKLVADSVIQPDEKVPTSIGDEMKSGYGVTNEVNAKFSTDAPSSHIATAQTSISYFPEFAYETYWRMLDLVSSGNNAKFEFKENEYSTYGQNVHFTPIWFPDGNYEVYTYTLDCWTPDGMLSINLSDSVEINGNLYDDWHIAPSY